MRPVDIRIELLKRGYSQRRVADDLGLDHRTVNTVLHGRGKSRRVAGHISQLVGIPTSVLWPGLYPDPVKRDSRKAA